MPMDINESQDCKLCGGKYSISNVVTRIKYYWKNVDVFVSSLPCCDATAEIRITSTKIIEGYVYAAGSPHFCGMIEYDNSEIEVEDFADRKRVIFNDKQFDVEIQ
jgi:hypothetical protein